MTDKIPLDAALRSRVADLLHLLQFARIETPTAGDAEQAEKAVNDLERMLAAPVAQEPVAWVCTARKPGITEQRSLWHGEQGADTWLAHFAGRGCEVTKTPLYAAPPAAEQPFRMLSAEEIAVRELLAAMNRDGGQHQHSVGIAQAAKDALTEFSRLQQTLAGQPDTVKVPRELLVEAESIIDSYAEALKASHAPGGDWDGEEAAQDDYEREAGVAAKLRALLAGGVHGKA